MTEFTTWRSLVDGEEISAIPDSVVSRPDDNDSVSDDPSRGLVINPNSTFQSVGVEISTNTSGVSRARLYDYDADQYIETVDVSDLSAGDAFKFDSEIKQGQDYGLEADNDGSSYTIGFNDGATDYPYTGEDIDIVAGSSGGNLETDRQAQVLNNVGNPQGILD